MAISWRMMGAAVQHNQKITYLEKLIQTNFPGAQLDIFGAPQVKDREANTEVNESCPTVVQKHRYHGMNGWP